MGKIDILISKNTDPIYIVSYYMKWVKTFWTYSMDWFLYTFLPITFYINGHLDNIETMDLDLCIWNHMKFWLGWVYSIMSLLRTVCTAIFSYTVLPVQLTYSRNNALDVRVGLFSFTLAVFPGSCCNILLK